MALSVLVVEFHFFFFSYSRCISCTSALKRAFGTQRWQCRLVGSMGSLARILGSIYGVKGLKVGLFDAFEILGWKSVGKVCEVDKGWSAGRRRDNMLCNGETAGTLSRNQGVLI